MRYVNPNPVSVPSSSTKNSGKKSKKNRNRGKQQEKTARNDAFEETVKTPREQNDDNTAQIQCWTFKYGIYRFAGFEMPSLSPEKVPKVPFWHCLQNFEVP